MLYARSGVENFLIHSANHRNYLIIRYWYVRLHLSKFRNWCWNSSGLILSSSFTYMYILNKMYKDATRISYFA